MQKIRKNKTKSVNKITVQKIGKNKTKSVNKVKYRNVKKFCLRYDGRLSFKDLNDNSILNNVQLEALITMWSPQLAFLNALGPFQTVVDDLRKIVIQYFYQ